MNPERSKRSVTFYTAQERESRIEEWRRSGLPQGLYCEQKGIALSSFKGWLKKLEQSSFSSGRERTGTSIPSDLTAFMPVHLTQGKASRPLSSNLEVTLPTGGRLRFEGVISWQDLLPHLSSFLKEGGC